MADLAQLADLKSYLGMAAGTLPTDAELQRELSAYSQFVRSYTNRDFNIQSYAITRSGRGSAAIFLPQYPIQSVTALTIDGQTVSAQSSFGSIGYRFDDRMIVLDGLSFTRGLSNIGIQFTAGYPTIPLDIQQATIELIGLRFKERDRIGHQSKSLGGETVSFIVRDMPASVRTVLDQYMAMVPA